MHFFPHDIRIFRPVKHGVCNFFFFFVTCKCPLKYIQCCMTSSNFNPPSTAEARVCQPALGAAGQIHHQVSPTDNIRSRIRNKMEEWHIQIHNKSVFPFFSFWSWRFLCLGRAGWIRRWSDLGWVLLQYFCASTEAPDFLCVHSNLQHTGKRMSLFHCIADIHQSSCAAIYYNAWKTDPFEMRKSGERLAEIFLVHIHY